MGLQRRWGAIFGLLLAQGGMPLALAAEPSVASASANLPAALYAMLLAFFLGAVAGVMLAWGRRGWLRTLAGLGLVVLILVSAVASAANWLALLLAIPVSMAIGGAIFASLAPQRVVLYCVIGFFTYVGLLTVLSLLLGAMTFVYGLVLPVALLALAGLANVLFSLMRATWQKSPMGFFQRVLIVGAVLLFLALLSGSFSESLSWWVVLGLTYLVALVVFCLGGGAVEPATEQDAGKGAKGGGGASGSW